MLFLAIVIIGAPVVYLFLRRKGRKTARPVSRHSANVRTGVSVGLHGRPRFWVSRRL